MLCKICLEEKNENEFYKNNLRCKKCRCLQCNEWRKNNKEKVSVARKKRRKRDSEEFLKRERELYYKNHEKNLNRAKKWREENRNKTRESTSKWQKNNREKIKEYVNKNKEKQKEYAKRSREKNPGRFKENIRKNIKLDRERYPEKNKARKLLFSALRVGFLIRPTACTKCLTECKPEGHHTDYSKPLDVIWLCRECHNKEHRKQ